jgi:TetR/AcrR family transcriptional regulator, transcriptional repressor for nem operon
MGRKKTKFQKDQREQILASTATLLKTKGVNGMSIGEIMAHAGLTHGAFYWYFSSKEELLCEATAYSLARGRGQWFADLASDEIRDYIVLLLGRYLRPEHRDNIKTACPIAATGTELSRMDKNTQAIVSKEISSISNEIEQCLREFGEDETEMKSHALMALCVGGLILSRLANTETSDQILRDCRSYGVKSMTQSKSSTRNNKVSEAGMAV